MKTLFLVLLKIALGVGLLFGFLRFMEWDESDLKNGTIFFLPYSLSYSYEGEDKGFEEAKDLYIDFDLSYIKLFKEIKCTDSIPKNYYREYMDIPVNNDGLRFLPVIVYKTKFLKSTSCAVADFKDYDKKRSANIPPAPMRCRSTPSC